MDNNFIALLKAMPKPLALGLGIAIALAILARILLPALLELLEADLPLRAVTQYLTLAVGWAPVPGVRVGNRGYHWEGPSVHPIGSILRYPIADWQLYLQC